MKKVLVAPSILSADFGNLEREIRDIERAGADLIHIDVMDGHFVPNITIGPVVIKGIRKLTKMPLDVHLMIDEPIRYVKEFRDAGSDWITVHYESCDDLPETIEAVRRTGAQTGLSLKPKTAIDERVKQFLPILDVVLIMSVEPGFGGQKFMPEAVPKIIELRKLYKGLISIDGGINAEYAPVVRKAGVDVLVAGTAVFGQKDRAKAIEKLRG
ncbi:MAG: ribulose-phosphate 3-epimerase [Candidatus Omnitrophica bacterium]|nr:ribulose-phosphate 3-epimerase [Candidatus Omnitrophota bacterium]